MAKTEFPRWSIGAGFEPNAFGHLSTEDRVRLIRLIARIAEQAYRRGAYQSAKLAASEEDLLPHDLYGWRHGMSLDKSPWLGDTTVQSSIERLFAECADLEALGFSLPTDSNDPNTPGPA